MRGVRRRRRAIQGPSRHSAPAAGRSSCGWPESIRRHVQLRPVRALLPRRVAVVAAAELTNLPPRATWSAAVAGGSAARAWACDRTGVTATSDTRRRGPADFMASPLLEAVRDVERLKNRASRIQRRPARPRRGRRGGCRVAASGADRGATCGARRGSPPDRRARRRPRRRARRTVAGRPARPVASASGARRRRPTSNERPRSASGPRAVVAARAVAVQVAERGALAVGESARTRGGARRSPRAGRRPGGAHELASG